MCTLLYLGSDLPLPLRAWDQARPAFHVDALGAGREAAVRSHFQGAHVYWVGSAEKCGCAFSKNEELEQTEAWLRQDTIVELHRYLRDAAELGARLELLACMAGSEGMRPLLRRALALEDVTPEGFL